MITVLVVGHTPPPYHGQAIMIAELLKLRHPDLKLVHVRMDFSAENSDLGRVRARKFVRLAATILAIWKAKLVHRPAILYYPPSGPKRVAAIRDIALLLATRFLFAKTVFHFHAAGISEVYPSLPALFRPLFRAALYGPDLAIGLSELNPEDGKALRARSERIIPYGIADLRPAGRGLPDAGNGPVTLLFVGIVCETKGAAVLLEACALLAARGFDFRVELMGRFESPGFEARLRALAAAPGLEGKVVFLGTLSGQAKADAFSRAGIFCFPSFYPEETFGVVLLEAMCFGLPVVATSWRGIPSVVAEGETGFLVPIRDPEAFAAKAAVLLADQGLRSRMGAAGRARYEAEFRLETWFGRMAQALLALGSP